ncbi:hypothetical protein OTK49_28470 [Vibrio coralliirubri]|uniref:hypothetical protein n=1 Tax=Vibrio coralliirubri TaxID=1516159 RepID=UPI0022849A75|nr:hypothetical protein [Vibrio coralliirubri]MCY9866479.1 hypothetical protein [Vibrio coralliirubri]
MFNESALISNAIWEQKIAENNTANEQLKIVCDCEWAKELPTLSSMTQHTANADIKISFNGDFEAIWAAVPDKVDVYYLKGGADDCARTPDYDGTKLEQLTTRYIDRKAEDFTRANVQMEYKEDSSMIFYSTVKGIKVCWSITISWEEFKSKYREKQIDSVTYSNDDFYSLLSI